MVEFFVFIFVAYGATNIMVFGSIFERFRTMMGVDSDNPNFFGKLFGCMMCLSFWWGVIISQFFTPLSEYISNVYLLTFFSGCLASGCVWLIHTIQEHFES